MLKFATKRMCTRRINFSIVSLHKAHGFATRATTMQGRKWPNRLGKFFLLATKGKWSRRRARRREMVVTDGVIMSVRTTSSCSSWHEEEGGRSTCGKSAYRSCIFQHMRRFDDSTRDQLHMIVRQKSLSTKTLKNSPERTR